jgi:hypothetical protein
VKVFSSNLFSSNVLCVSPFFVRLWPWHVRPLPDAPPGNE